MLDGEEAYTGYLRVIENANVIMATYTDERMGDCMVFPDKGTVSFSAGLHGWAFTLTTFAKMYAAKFGIEEAKMMERLWGDHFFDPATKKWTKKSTGTATCKRGYYKMPDAAVMAATRVLCCVQLRAVCVRTDQTSDRSLYE